MILRCMLVVLASSSWAGYAAPMPHFRFEPSMQFPTPTEYRLDSVDAQAVRVLPEADSLGAPTEPLGVLVATGGNFAVGDSQATGWRDTLPGLLQSQILTRLNGLIPTKPGDFGTIDDTLWADSIPVYLTRPQPGATTRAMLVVGRPAYLLRRAIEIGKPSATLPVRDVRLPWGLWDGQREKWVAWGRLSLRKFQSDWREKTPVDASEVLSFGVLQELPMAFVGSLKARQRREKWGGLLLGVTGTYGIHPMARLAKYSANKDVFLASFGMGLSVGWFPSTWGVTFQLPVYSMTKLSHTISSPEPYVYVKGADPASLKVYTSFDPLVEFTAIFPNPHVGTVGQVGLTGMLGIGYQNLTGTTAFWGDAAPSGSGWFLRPGAGYTISARYWYFASDLAIEFRSARFGGMDYRSTAVSTRMQVGFRLAHD